MKILNLFVDMCYFYFLLEQLYGCLFINLDRFSEFCKCFGDVDDSEEEFDDDESPRSRKSVEGPKQPVDVSALGEAGDASIILKALLLWC